MDSLAKEYSQSTQLCACINAFLNTHTHTYLYLHAYTYTCMRVCKHVLVYKQYKIIHCHIMHIYIHTGIHTHRLTHTYTCISSYNNYVDIHISKHTCILAQACVGIYTNTRINMYTSTLTRTKCIHTLTHTHIYSCAYMCMCICCVCGVHYKKLTLTLPTPCYQEFIYSRCD